MTEEEWYVEWSGYYEAARRIHAIPLTYQQWCERWGYKPEGVEA